MLKLVTEDVEDLAVVASFPLVIAVASEAFPHSCKKDDTGNGVEQLVLWRSKQTTFNPKKLTLPRNVNLKQVDAKSWTFILLIPLLIHSGDESVQLLQR